MGQSPGCAQAGLLHDVVLLRRLGQDLRDHAIFILRLLEEVGEVGDALALQRIQDEVDDVVM